ncbi:MAG: FliM/FliN family flagellar motor switch protein [Planctomycetota bacterium]
MPATSPNDPIRRVLALEVPLVVRIGERRMTVGDVTGLAPGAIIELPKNAEEELDVLVNNRTVGTGAAVKIGENFGIRINFIGDIGTRLAAMAGSSDPIDEDIEASMHAGLGIMAGVVR